MNSKPYKLFFLLSLFTGFYSYSQQNIDTTFSVREFTCTCKYNYNDDFKGIFYRSEQPARYPGGEREWKKFVRKNLDKSFRGEDQVEVQFQVDRNGDLSEFELMTSSPAQKYQEAVRILKLSGKWFPAIQNGYCVKAYFRQIFGL